MTGTRRAAPIKGPLDTTYEGPLREEPYRHSCRKARLTTPVPFTGRSTGESPLNRQYSRYPPTSKVLRVGPAICLSSRRRLSRSKKKASSRHKSPFAARLTSFSISAESRPRTNSACSCSLALGNSRRRNWSTGSLSSNIRRGACQSAERPGMMRSRWETYTSRSPRFTTTAESKVLAEINRTSSRANPRSTRPFPQSQKAAAISSAIIAAIPAMYSRWFFQARW